MRKLIAVLCVIAMMVMSVPALANPSVTGTVTVQAPEGVTITQADGINIAAISNPVAQDVVSAVNGTGVMTPAQAAEALGASVEELGLGDKSFTSQFMEINCQEPTNITIDDKSVTLLFFINADGTMSIININPDGTFTIPGPGFFATLGVTPV